MMVWLWFACAVQPDWSERTALSGILHRLDENADQQVSKNEFDKHDYASPGFGRLDTNSDGALSSTELHSAMLTSDPLIFDHQPPQPALPRSAASAYQTLPDDVRMIHDLFVFLQEEIGAIDDNFQPIPSADLLAAAHTKSLQSPQSMIVLNFLQQGYENTDMAFPPRLSSIMLTSP